MTVDRPRCADVATYLYPIDAARKRPPQHLRQSRDRSEDPNGIAMDEHEAGIGINPPDVVERKHVIRRFQDPPAPREIDVQMLKKAPMEAIGIEQAAALQPAAVGRDPVRALETQALNTWAVMSEHSSGASTATG